MANPNDEAGVDRLVADARAMDKLNQSVVAEFRAKGGKVGGDLEGMPVLLLTMTGAKTGRTFDSSAVLFARRRSPGHHRFLRRSSS